MSTSSKKHKTNLVEDYPYRTNAPWLLNNFDSPNWTVLSHIEGNAKEVQVTFDEVLPDRSYLTDSANHHFLEDLRRIAFDCRSGPKAFTGSGINQAAIVKNLFNLVSWMVLKGIPDFSSLTPFDIDAYLNEASMGYEECFNTVERMEEAIQEMLADGTPAKELTVRKAFEFAGIPYSLCPRLPRALAVYYEVTSRKNEAEFPEENKIEDEDGDLIQEFEQGLAFSFKNDGSGNGSSSDLDTERLRANTLFNKAYSISLLWEFRNSLRYPLTFAPFPEGILAKVNLLGSKGGHTRTMPVNVAFHLAESATKWVMYIGPKLLELRDKLREVEASEGETKAKVKISHLLEEFNNSEEGKMIGRALVRKGIKEKNVLTIRTAVNCYLPTACFIVIAILSARRDIEIKSLELDAIVGTADTGWWLKSLIAKTARRIDHTPCPQLVVTAVSLLKLVSAPARPLTESKKLFITPVNNGTKKLYNNFRIDVHLNNFARHVGVPLARDGDNEFQWWFAPHQFRRIFAILFVWRFERAHLGALSYHLRHFNLRMTLVYVRDSELRRYLGEEFHRLTVTKLKSIAGNEINAAGTFGKTLKRMIERLRKQVDIADNNDLERKIIRLVEDRKLSLKATEWGYCGATSASSNIRRAACQSNDNLSRALDIDGTPDASGSDEFTCARCLFHFTDDSRKQHWMELEQSLAKAIENPGLANLMRNALQARLSVISSFIRNSLNKREAT